MCSIVPRIPIHCCKFKTELTTIFFLVVLIYWFSNCLITTFRSHGCSKILSTEPFQNVTKTDPLIRTNIFFLKTHKTGSSTVQNILMRFGLRHSLNFLLPKESNYIGYTSSVKMSMVRGDTIPKDRKFNIMTHHSRFGVKTLEFLYDDVIKVTLLRYPPKHFESVYKFFALDKQYGVQFEDMIRSLPNTTVKFKRQNIFARSINQMSVDLGFNADRYYKDENEVQKFLNIIDSHFDLVMINEYMDASLVLLADLMSWPLSYVSYLSQLTRDGSKYEMTKDDEQKLSELNNVDSLLYNHFLEKFREHLIEYGPIRLEKSINTLRRINEDIYNRCVEMEDRSGYASTIGYKLKNDSDWECTHITKSELLFTKEIRNQQGMRLNVTRKTLELIYNKK